jgi:hypothetical protein
MSAAGESGRVLVGGSVSCGSGVTAAVAGLIGLEVSERSGTARRHRTVVAVMGVVAVVDVTDEAARAVEPGAGADEEAADEPVGAIVAVGCAVIGCVVEVAVGADGCSADADNHLTRGRRGAVEGESSDGDSREEQ